MTKRALAALAVLAIAPMAAFAQKPVVQSDSVEITTTIEAIDYTARLVTLKDKDGSMETIYAPPEMKRFSELKVGDKVTFRYYESRVYQIRKPGQPAPTAGDSGPAVVRGSGPRPGATVSEQQTATVTIKSVDVKTSSVTVTTESGRNVAFKVDDKKNLEGLKAGDKVDITYTQAVMISVK